MNRGALADLSDTFRPMRRSSYLSRNLDALLAGDVGRMLRTNCERHHAWRALILSAQRRQGRTFSATTADFWTFSPPLPKQRVKLRIGGGEAPLKMVSSTFLGPRLLDDTKPDLDRTRMAAGGECCVCTAAGAAPLRRRRCGLRQSARDRRAAEGSSSSLAAALAASTCRAPDYASQHERCLRRCCVADGAAPYHQRVGTFM